jgi:hypothetical protein
MTKLKTGEKVKLIRKPLRDITGQRFGNLEVLRMEITSSSHGNEWKAICKCHVCGREDFECRPASMKNIGRYKNYKSCGCDRAYCEKQTGANSVLFKGYKELHGCYLSDIKRRSKKLGFDFDIDLIFLWELYLRQNRKCALSGVSINFAKRSRNKKEGTASLDRIDSTKGYVKDNVQWVHKSVNLMKMYLTESLFLDFCKKIYFNNKTKKKNDIMREMFRVF